MSILAACNLGRAGGLAPDPVGQASRGQNAAWLGIEWVNEPLAEAAVTCLAADLQRYRITTAYVYTTYMRNDSTFGATYTYAPSFVRRIKEAYPELTVQAWIGLPLKPPIPDLWEGAVDRRRTSSLASVVSSAR